MWGLTGVLLRADMSWPEIIFTTFGGLRGAVSLILAQAVVTEQAPNPTLQNQKVTAQVRAACCCMPATLFRQFTPALREW